MSQDEELQGSEFELSVEEQAQLEAEENAEKQIPESQEELTEEEIEALLKGESDTPAVQKDPEQPAPDDGNHQENDEDGDTPPQPTEEPNTQTVDPEVNPELATPASEPDHIDFEGQYTTAKAQYDEAIQKRDDVLNQIEELGGKLDGGEIGEGTYQARLKRLEINLEDANKDIGQADQSIHAVQQKYQEYVAQSQTQVAQVWQQELDKFVQDNPTYATDAQYQQKFDDVLFDLQGKGAFDGLTYPQIIASVQHRVELELGKPASSKAVEQPVPPPVEQKKVVPKRESVEIPTAISQLQTLEPNAASDEFAALDKLDGLAYETALEKLQDSNPDAYKRYMAR